MQFAHSASMCERDKTGKLPEERSISSILGRNDYVDHVIGPWTVHVQNPKVVKMLFSKLKWNTFVFRVSK